MLQDKPGSLLGVATSAADARVMLEALEAGTAGAVLRTNDPLQVCTNTHSPSWHRYGVWTDMQPLYLLTPSRVVTSKHAKV